MKPHRNSSVLSFDVDIVLKSLFICEVFTNNLVGWKSGPPIADATTGLPGPPREPCLAHRGFGADSQERAVVGAGCRGPKCRRSRNPSATRCLSEGLLDQGRAKKRLIPEQRQAKKLPLTTMSVRPRSRAGISSSIMAAYSPPTPKPVRARKRAKLTKFHDTASKEPQQISNQSDVKYHAATEPISSRDVGRNLAGLACPPG